MLLEMADHMLKTVDMEVEAEWKRRRAVDKYRSYETRGPIEEIQKETAMGRSSLYEIQS